MAANEPPRLAARLVVQGGEEVPGTRCLILDALSAAPRRSPNDLDRLPGCDQLRLEQVMEVAPRRGVLGYACWHPVGPDDHHDVDRRSLVERADLFGADLHRGLDAADVVGGVLDRPQSPLAQAALPLLRQLQRGEEPERRAAPWEGREQVFEP